MGAWCRIEPKVTSRTAPIAAKMPSDVTISLSETSKCTQASASSHPTLARGGAGETEAAATATSRSPSPSRPTFTETR